MWKCPRCQRVFARTEQGHFCGKPKDIEEYIMSQDEEARERLRVIRRIIGEAIPEAAEKISWSMPTYWKGRNIIHFAAAKRHVGIYPGEEAVAAFAGRLEGYSMDKGTVRIGNDQRVPEDVLRDMAKWCLEKYGK